MTGGGFVRACVSVAGLIRFRRPAPDTQAVIRLRKLISDVANPEHLEILKQGVQSWNAWREVNPEVRPDLSGAQLSKTRLSNAKLFRVNLIRADLSKADLSEAALGGANFYKADLRWARLDKVDLRWANLRSAYLSSADLRWANLRWANLTSAYLSEAKLDGARFGETLLGDTNMVKATGLALCRHDSHSMIDMRTLRWSWPVPRAFLRGCGLPESFIDYLPSLLEQPFEFYTCFISYSHRDEAFARRLHADLQDRGIRCWFAPVRHEGW